MHKGKLSFTSSQASGSTFTVKIPLNSEALEPFVIAESYANPILPTANDFAAAKTHPKGQSIMVAEDDDELREYLTRELLAMGYKVSSAANGKEALLAIKNSPVDLVITDVMMPQMNGFQLCTLLKKEIATCHIPVIMLTAIHDRDYLLQGYKSGADDYVKKPFDLSYILTRIENLLQNRTRFRNKIMSIFEQDTPALKVDGDLLWLKKVTELVLENLIDPDFSVEKLSSMMATSRPVLFRKFKAITGDAPQQFISQVRLRKAVELLQLKQHNINEVAYMTGFSDPKYFSTLFKKHFGKSPREYLQDVRPI